jgi:predicted metal-dependent hydrolase
MQKTQNILNYKGIGDVNFVRSPRARNLSIRINQQGEVRVTRPRYVSQKRAELFFLSKQEWIKKKLDETGSAANSGYMPVDGEYIRIRNKSIQIRLLPQDKNTEAAIWRILKEEALQYLPGRVSEISALHGFSITGLKIRQMKTRWGSCTAKKSINLNSWLLMLPLHLSDYVILHELVHTRFPDHSKRFWDELDRVCGGKSKQYRKELRDHRIMCFPKNLANQ